MAEGGKVKKHSKSEFNFEATTNKCQSMSYFDQHVVTWQCAVTVQEMLNSFAMGNSNYLPVQEHVAFLFDLMEMALNIYGLIDMCIQVQIISDQTIFQTNEFNQKKKTKLFSDLKRASRSWISVDGKEFDFGEKLHDLIKSLCRRRITALQLLFVT